MFTIEMKRAKETKGAVVFEEGDPPPGKVTVLRTLYVRKDALSLAGKLDVQKITVTINEA